MANKSTAKQRIVLLDSHAIIHRAYHALPDFMNSEGQPTGAIYGLATMLFKIITELKPDFIIACFDLPKKTFRHEAYEGYKAGRAKADEELVLQLIKSRDFFKALSIPIYEKEGFEADDLLGTIVKKLKNKKNTETIIASGDMDTLQLVEGDSVLVYTLKKGISDTILYNQQKVFDRFNFLPENLPDYKGLNGDPSDNIIGIKGIGDKTATTLISKFGTIEKIYKSLKKGDSELKSLGLTDRIVNLIKEGEEEALFSKTLATIRTDAPIDFSLPKKKWKDMVDKDKVAEFFRQMEFRSLQGRFLKILDDKEEIQSVNEETKEPKDKIEKAKIAYWLLNSERTNSDIEEIKFYKGSKTLDEAISKMEEDIEKENMSYVYKEIELPIVSIIKQMEENGILIDVNYLKKISKEYHQELSIIEKNIYKIAGQEFNINSPKQLAEILFDKLNIPTKGIKKSAGGSISTRESELEKIKEDHPIAKEILKHRELQKLLSTYIDTLPSFISGDGRLRASFIQTGTTTGRFASNNPNLQNIPTRTEKGNSIRNAFIAKPGHLLVSFDYSQIELRVAALLSQDPYFIRSFKQGKDIHTAVAMKVFNVNEENVTAEMRRRAKIINFGILYGMGVNALRENLGTDRKEAQIFYDNYFKQFPTIRGYLDSIKDFAKQNGYTITLFGRKRYFPAIKSPVPFIRAMAERMATNAPIQGTATADIIKIGMKKADYALKDKKLDSQAKLLLQVHDELIYEVKKDKLEEVIDIVKNSMEDIIPSKFLEGLDPVPLRVSVAYGQSWGVLK
ncbi:MAG TPA: DNA polymerase [Candidatus Paceibacterota bacterium]|jgi:DNA polymerase-1|nr:DNA polymerase [Candidatus Paceibacterota bacterium]